MKEENTEKTARWLLGGGILAALTASLCCIGPTAFILLGLGGFAAAGFFETLRPLFLGLSALVLAFAWYRVCFRKVSCQEGETCTARQRSKTSKVVLVLVTLAAIALGAYPQLAEIVVTSGEPLPAVTKEAYDINQAQLEITISGMDCASCAIGIEHVLKRTVGVIDANVVYDAKQATVFYDASRITSDQIIKAIAGTGFEAQAVN